MFKLCLFLQGVLFGYIAMAAFQGFTWGFWLVALLNVALNGAIVATKDN